MRVYSVLPEAVTSGADAVLAAAGIEHVAHIDGPPVDVAAAAAADPRCVALLGPFRSRDVAEAVEATAPAGLPLIAPAATWSGVTRADEPGAEDDPAAHHGTILRLVARDTEVARRISAHVASAGLRALVVAGDHEYGDQLDRQLHITTLPRGTSAQDAGLVVLCGLEDGDEIARVRAVAPSLPVIAFDGVQGADLGADRDVSLALPFAPLSDVQPFDWMAYAARRAAYGAQLVADAVRDGAGDRAAALAHMRAAGGFDEHGDPREPDVWLWRAGADWALSPLQPL